MNRFVRVTDPNLVTYLLNTDNIKRITLTDNGKRDGLAIAVVTFVDGDGLRISMEVRDAAPDDVDAAVDAWLDELAGIRDEWSPDDRPAVVPFRYGDAAPGWDGPFNKLESVELPDEDTDRVASNVPTVAEMAEAARDSAVGHLIDLYSWTRGYIELGNLIGMDSAPPDRRGLWYIDRILRNLVTPETYAEITSDWEQSKRMVWDMGSAPDIGPRAETVL